MTLLWIEKVERENGIKYEFIFIIIFVCVCGDCSYSFRLPIAFLPVSYLTGESCQVPNLFDFGGVIEDRTGEGMNT